MSSSRQALSPRENILCALVERNRFNAGLACRKLKENDNNICRARKMLFFALLLSL
jgi:hypothetical protein